MSESRNHLKFRQMVNESDWSSFLLKEEVPVSEICSNYPNNQDRFDFYIPEVCCIIEIHGEQHYRPVAFGGMDYRAANDRYIKQLKKDSMKREAAIQENLIYVIFKYDEPITFDSLMNKINEFNEEPVEVFHEIKNNNTSLFKEDNDYDYKEIMRKKRREYYKRNKHLLKLKNEKN